MNNQQAGWQKLITGDFHPDFVDQISHLSNGVEFTISPWKIILDSGEVIPGKSLPPAIRLTAQFLNPAGFKFNISRKSAFEKLMDTVTMAANQFGLPKFEHDFIIHCSDKEQMKALLSNSAISTHLPRIPFESFGTTGAYDSTGVNLIPGISILSLKIPGDISGFLQDPRRLTSLLEMYKEILSKISQVPAVR